MWSKDHALCCRQHVDEGVVGFGNVLVKPESGPNPSVVLHLHYAMPSERLDTAQLLKLRDLIDTLIEPGSTL